MDDPIVLYVVLGVNGVGVVGIVAYIGRLIARGQWVPRSTYEDQIHESNENRAESRIKDQQIQELHDMLAERDKQLAHMREVGRLVEALARAIQTVTGITLPSREEAP